MGRGVFVDEVLRYIDVLTFCPSSSGPLWDTERHIFQVLLDIHSADDLPRKEDAYAAGGITLLPSCFYAKPSFPALLNIQQWMKRPDHDFQFRPKKELASTPTEYRTKSFTCQRWKRA